MEPRRNSLTLIGTVLGLLLGAQSAAAFHINPLRTKLLMEPATQTQGVIQVTNEEKEPAVLGVTFRDQSRDKGHFTGWINIDTADLSLKPGETKPIRYLLTIPEEATGELSGRVVFENKGKKEGGMLSMRTRISVPFAVIIKGTEIYGGEVTGIHIIPHKQPRVSIDLANTGNVHVRPAGFCSISQGGKKITSFPVNTGGHPVYPGKTETLIANLPQALESGQYEAHIEFPFPDKENLVKATLPLVVP